MASQYDRMTIASRAMQSLITAYYCDHSEQEYRPADTVESDRHTLIAADAVRYADALTSPWVETSVNSSAPVDVALKHPEYDQLLSYLLSQYDSNTGLEALPACASLIQAHREVLAAEVKKIADAMTLPLEIVHRNPGISPFAMQKLLAYFQGRKKPVEELLPVLPESEDAVQVFNNIFGRINSHLAPVFAPAARTFALAILVVEWMRGFPLARLIGARIAYFDEKQRSYEVASMIRSVMDDVEQVARFTAPRYLSCYLDVLRQHLKQLPRLDLLEQIPDVNLWLEFGASQVTQLSLMGLGLSRTTAIAVSEFIADDSLSQDEVFEKLKELEIETLGLPLAIVRELRQLIGVPTGASDAD